MPPKRQHLPEGQEGEFIPYRKQPKTYVRLPIELEDQIGQWWKKYPVFYDINHHHHHRTDIKDEILLQKVIELQQDEQWADEEVVKNLTVVQLRKYMKGIRDYITRTSRKSAQGNEKIKRRRKVFSFLRAKSQDASNQEVEEEVDEPSTIDSDVGDSQPEAENTPSTEQSATQSVQTTPLSSRPSREPPHSSRSSREQPHSSRSSRKPPPSTPSTRELPHSSRSSKKPPPSSPLYREPPPSSFSSREPPPSYPSYREQPPSSTSSREPPDSSRLSRELLQRELRAAIAHHKGKNKAPSQTPDQICGQSYGVILGHFLAKHPMATQQEIWSKIMKIVLSYEPEPSSSASEIQVKPQPSSPTQVTVHLDPLLSSSPGHSSPSSDTEL